MTPYPSSRTETFIPLNCWACWQLKVIIPVPFLELPSNQKSQLKQVFIYSLQQSWLVNEGFKCLASLPQSGTTLQGPWLNSSSLWQNLLFFIPPQGTYQGSAGGPEFNSFSNITVTDSLMVCKHWQYWRQNEDTSKWISLQILISTFGK